MPEILELLGLVVLFLGGGGLAVWAVKKAWGSDGN